MEREQFKAKFQERTLKGGEYKVKELKGIGAQGAVFLAEDTHDHSLVAVKLFDTSMKMLDVEKEARTQARLHHPNIVPFQWHDTEEIASTDDRGVQVVEKYPFIVMMYANKGSLNDQVHKKGGILPIEESVDYLVQAANGVQYAHDKRVLHRDIKPANFLLHQHSGNDHLDLMVSDFGIAIKAHTGTLTDPFSTQIIAGTPPYMAPEHFDGEAVKGSDLYSLGTVAFELLTGKKPFTARSVEEYRKAHTRYTPPSFEQIRGNQMNNILGELEGAVRKALEKKPEERQSSIGDFGQELKDTYERAKGKAAKEKQIIDVARIRRQQEQAKPQETERQKWEKERSKFVEIARRGIEYDEKHGRPIMAGYTAAFIGDNEKAKEKIKHLLGKEENETYTRYIAALIGDTNTAKKRIKFYEEDRGRAVVAGMISYMDEGRDMLVYADAKDDQGEAGLIASLSTKTSKKIEWYEKIGTYGNVLYITASTSTNEKAKEQIVELQKAGNHRDAAHIAAYIRDAKTVENGIKYHNDGNAGYIAALLVWTTDKNYKKKS